MHWNPKSGWALAGQKPGNGVLTPHQADAKVPVVLRGWFRGSWDQRLGESWKWVVAPSSFVTSWNLCLSRWCQPSSCWKLHHRWHRISCCDSLMPQGTRGWAGAGAGAQTSCWSLMHTRNDVGEGGNLSLLQTELSGHDAQWEFGRNWREQHVSLGGSQQGWACSSAISRKHWAQLSSAHFRHSLPLPLPLCHRARINTGPCGRVKANPCCWKTGRAGLSWVQVVGNSSAPGCPELLQFLNFQDFLKSSCTCLFRIQTQGRKKHENHTGKEAAFPWSL